MTEYCYLDVTRWLVAGDDRKQRGWRNDGIAAGVRQAMASGDVVIHELAAQEEKFSVNSNNEIIWHPSWEFRQAFLALLNRLATEGWTVVDYTPSEIGGFGDAHRKPWPLVDFLLVRES